MARPRESTPATTPERRAARELLKRACFVSQSETVEAAIGPLLADPVDWDDVLQYGARHRVLGLVEYALRHVSSRSLDAVPEQVRRHLLAAGLQHEVETRTKLSLVKSLLERLGARGIGAMVLKGLTLAALYPELRLRPSDDIDLLVGERDWPVVARVLDELSLRPRPGRLLAAGLSPDEALHLVSYVGYGEIQYRTPSDGLLEVHFRVFNVGIPAAVEDVWGRQRVERVAGVELPTIGFEDAVLFHAVHANWHRFCRLIWFADLHRMMRAWAGRMDWQWLVSRARDRRMGRALACAIELTQQLGGPIAGVPPEEVLEPPGRRAMERYRRRWVTPAVQDLEQASRFSFDAIWYYLRETATWGEWMKCVLRGMFPPRACLGGESRWSYLCRLATDRFDWLKPVVGRWVTR